MTAAVAGAAGVGLFAVQDRTIGEGIDDAAASAALKARLLRTENNAYSRVDVEVAQGAALLSGAVPTMNHRIEAERIAWTIPQITQVANELTVGPRSGFFRSVMDEAITAQVRARLVADAAVRAVNVNVETNDGVVYLMGLARSDAELARAAEAAAYVRGVKRVVSYMQVRERPADLAFGQAAPAPWRQGAHERVPQEQARWEPAAPPVAPETEIDAGAPLDLR
jgi:osmotically-inducible protein OsmY